MSVRKLFVEWMRLPEKLRFLLVGGYNTVFSLGLFALLYEGFNGSIPYLTVLVVTHLISVLNSFFALRIFVFGAGLSHWFIEYLRVNLIYSVYLALNSALLFLAVSMLNYWVLPSQILITCFLLIFSYIGNKYFTFKK